MEDKAGRHESADLRYLAAEYVRCPAGTLAEFRVTTEDAKPLGSIEGVLITARSGASPTSCCFRRGS